MDKYLVNTDVVSYFAKGDTRAVLYEPLLEDRELAISFMTVAELRLWARTRDWGPSRLRRLEEFLERYGVLPCDDATCTAWADAIHSARRAGRPIQVADAWIAATALVYDLPLVTNNPSDYVGVEGLRILTA